MIEKESWKHFIQTNKKKLSELQVKEKGWSQITKTSNAAQFQDACPEIDERPIKNQE